MPFGSGITTHARRKLWRRPVFFASLGLVPPAIGAGVAALTGSRRTGAIAGAISALGLVAVRWQLQRLFTDEPDYIVEQRLGDLELRRYLPHIEAQTQVAGVDFDAAIEHGFRRLARYIFGGNQGGERLEMTAPVTARGEKLEMTAPVVASAQGAGHTIAFIMPPARSLASLPRPLDRAVKLVEVPPRRVAVLAYRGRYRGDVVSDRAAELRRLVSAAGLTATGEPRFAGFDPPTTLPWLRRNEIWLELA